MSVRGTREKVQIAYIGGRPHPPLPMAHTHPGVCIVPLGPNKCVSHGVLWVHFVRRHHPWWPAAVARPSEAAPATFPVTFPASFPADPKMCWISYGMVGGTYLGVLGPPVSEILIRPASVKGTCATYPRSDGNRMIPRLGVVGKSLQCCTCSPICCCFMGLSCVGLLPTTFITVAGWRVSPAALLLSWLCKPFITVAGWRVSPAALLLSRLWLDSCNRADHATRLVQSPILPVSVALIVCGISIAWWWCVAQGKSPNCIYMGETSPPLPMAHTHPGVCIVPLGPNKCVSHGVLWVHFVRRHHPWWPAAVARPSEAALATFPADPKMCWISYGMVGGTYLGVLGPPVSEILIRPASVKGTCATYPRSDGNRMIPRLGVVGKSLQCCTCSPICCCFMGLSCVGLLPTTFITVAGWRVSPAALLLSWLCKPFITVAGWRVSPAALLLSRLWLDSCNRADHATRLVQSPILPVSVALIVCGISIASVAVRARGFLGLP
jgi:hypothetical protein